jgi:hypothetical protein
VRCAVRVLLAEIAEEVGDESRIASECQQDPIGEQRRIGFRRSREHRLARGRRKHHASLKFLYLQSADEGRVVASNTSLPVTTPYAGVRGVPS